MAIKESWNGLLEHSEESHFPVVGLKVVMSVVDEGSESVVAEVWKGSSPRIYCQIVI